MNPSICRAYKIVIPTQGNERKAMLELAELPSRTHLLLSFVNQEIPGGVGIPLDRSLVQGLIELLRELEGRMEGIRKDSTRTITLPEEGRLDDLKPPF